MLIPKGFGQDGGGGNATVQAIAANDAGVREAGHWLKSVAINQQVARRDGKRRHGPVHGQVAGLGNVDAGNFIYRCLAYCPGNGLGANDGPQGIAPLSTELLGIVEEARVEIRRQNNGRREHRTRQAAPASFIEARFEGMASVRGKEHKLIKEPAKIRVSCPVKVQQEAFPVAKLATGKASLIIYLGLPVGQAKAYLWPPALLPITPGSSSPRVNPWLSTGAMASSMFSSSSLVT